MTLVEREPRTGVAPVPAGRESSVGAAQSSRSTNVCGHYWHKFGKVLRFPGECLDWRECAMCGLREFKGQSERWQ